MDLYFFKVLYRVREHTVRSYRRRRATHYAPSMHSREPSIDGASEGKSLSPSVTPSRPVSPGIPPPQLKKHESHGSVRFLSIQPPDRPPRQDDDEDAIISLESQASAIWCTLVLRMLCWLLLHDFNKKDVQIPKSELLGSRLPVYIA
ncbi:hypothetical protein C8A05DRAFT_37043 [Staphylotrichum tortipilum]|uniref:Uncharacterized protein n=1 Tax=Staphylotrichum tortipilum TaxID=2831512 RepID=A0AAN6MFU8_9PEZI|nr:hypothetical protein C8A05DRAFT_37043 [Staphylotrichum longicolle]